MYSREHAPGFGFCHLLTAEMVGDGLFLRILRFGFVGMLRNNMEDSHPASCYKTDGWMDGGMDNEPEHFIGTFIRKYPHFLIQNSFGK